MLKSEIRGIFKEKRAAMSFKDVKSKSSAAASVFLKTKIYENAKSIMLYMPLGNEMDTSEITQNAFKNNKIVALPVTKRGEITPYIAEPDTAYEQGEFKISEPQNTQSIDLSEIDVVIVPGIAFDKYGARVGFGKGCYDKLLKNYRGIKVGFCYDFQLIDKIPSQEFDVKMDYLLTEIGLTKCEK